MNTFSVVVILCFFVYLAIVLFIAARGEAYLKNFLLCSGMYICALMLIVINNWFLKLANPYTLGFVLPLLFIISVAFFLVVLFTKGKLVTKRNTIIHFSIFIVALVSFFITYLFIGTPFGFQGAIGFTFNIPLSPTEKIYVNPLYDIESGFNIYRLYSLYFFIGMVVQVHSILSFSFFMMYFIRKKIALGLLFLSTWVFSLEIIYLLAIFDFMRPW